MPLGCLQRIAANNAFNRFASGAGLPGFASETARGMANGLSVSGPVFAVFSSGGHDLRIERAKAIPKGQPFGQNYTLETVCGAFKRGTVCWAIKAANESALRTFENGVVALDGEDAWTLVPENAFEVAADSFAGEPPAVAKADGGNEAPTSPRPSPPSDRVGELIGMLRDGNSTNRVIAAYQLGEIKDARAIEPLRVATGDADSTVRQRAEEALAKIKGHIVAGASGGVQTSGTPVAPASQPSPSFIRDPRLPGYSIYSNGLILPNGVSPEGFDPLFGGGYYELGNEIVPITGAEGFGARIAKFDVSVSGRVFTLDKQVVVHSPGVNYQSRAKVAVAGQNCRIESTSGAQVLVLIIGTNEWLLPDFDFGRASRGNYVYQGRVVPR
jgi:hypothetical protein